LDSHNVIEVPGKLIMKTNVIFELCVVDFGFLFFFLEKHPKMCLNFTVKQLNQPVFSIFWQKFV